MAKTSYDLVGRGTEMADQDDQTASTEITLAGERDPKYRVGAKVRQLEGSQRRIAEPFEISEAEWRPALKRALGTTSGAFVEASLQRLIQAAMMPGEPIASTVSLSAALAFIQSLEPENEVQAALAVNAACLHAASANVLSRLYPVGGERRIVPFSTAAARLERAFHSALDTFYRVKRGNLQVIRVEKLEVQAGGQAVIGTVRHKG